MFWKTPYTKFATLSGPQNAILSVSFSVDGDFVAAAGYSGVTIWDLKTSQAVPTPHLPYEPNERKHVHCSSAWLFFEAGEKHVFIFGNMAGQVTLWHWDGHDHQMFRVSGNQSVYRNEPEKVMSMDVLQARVPADKDTFFVTSTNDYSVSVWKLDSSLELSNVFKVDLPPDFIPRTVQFSRASCTVFAFSKTGGSFLQLNGKSGELAWIKKEGLKRMDSVALDEGKDIFAAWTGKHAAAFRQSDAEHITTFRNEGCYVANAKQIGFAEEGSTVVVGTDYSSAEVFSLDTGRRVQSLPYPGRSLVHYIATLTLPSSYLVAIAGSTKSQPAQVVIFTKKRFISKPGSFLHPSEYIGGRGWIAFICFMLAVFCIVFFNYYPNFFLFGIEFSVNPLGLGLHGFVYIPCLSKYMWSWQNSNVIDAAVIANLASTVTVIEPAFSTVTVIEPAFFTVTVIREDFVTVIEQVTHTVFEAVPVTFTFTSATTIVPMCPTVISTISVTKTHLDEVDNVTETIAPTVINTMSVTKTHPDEVDYVTETVHVG
ncbi:hypothetical protein D9758_017354 [Tetrapyrgos nigripes]|uniref:Uncharacterized protein n=1 Tax=Tetrapyrgos nigripes TaxID=182062 RepID=A0A8H5C3T2_9AGAR|nr:hypothetical protein D9758_017354 [Tetrapyrgos nigripes]